jgi:hypothetical protein
MLLLQAVHWGFLDSYQRRKYTERLFIKQIVRLLHETQKEQIKFADSGRGSETEEIAIKEEVLTDQKIEDLRFD